MKEKQSVTLFSPPAALLLIPVLLLGACRVPGRYSASTDVARLRQLRDKRSQEASSLEREIHRLEARIKGLRAEEVKSREERDRLADGLAPLLDTLNHLRQDVGAARERLDREKRQVQALAKERDGLKAKLGELGKVQQQLAGRIKAIEKDLPALQKRIAALDKEGSPALQAARAREAELVKQCAAAGKELQARIAGLERLLELVQQAIAAPGSGTPKKAGPPASAPKKK